MLFINININTLYIKNINVNIFNIVKMNRIFKFYFLLIINCNVIYNCNNDCDSNRGI